MRPYLFALLFAVGSLAAQTNVLSSAPASSATNASAPGALAASRPSATIHIETSDAVQVPGASLDSPCSLRRGRSRTAILKKLQQRAAEDQAVSARVKLGDQLSQANFTGQVRLSVTSAFPQGPPAKTPGDPLLHPRFPHANYALSYSILHYMHRHVIQLHKVHLSY